MASIRITIETDGATLDAARKDPRILVWRLAPIFGSVCADILLWGIRSEQVLRDMNSNVVGKVEVIE